MASVPQIEDDLSDVLRKARFGLDLAPRDVAEAAGCSEADLRAWEQGALPPAEHLTGLAQALRLKAGALDLHRTGKVQGADLPSGVEAIWLSRYNVNAYLLEAPTGLLLIDAGDEADRLIAACANRKLHAILITHGHHDHVEAAAEVAARSGAAVYGPAGLGLDDYTVVQEGEHVFGYDVWHVPGHSDDHLAFVSGRMAFVGDVCYAGSLGRATNPGRYAALLASARRLFALPAGTVLLPGHGPGTTPALEAIQNPFC